MSLGRVSSWSRTSLQGLLGASMIPTLFTASLLPRAPEGLVSGTIACVAPTLGPVIRDFIDDALD